MSLEASAGELEVVRREGDAAKASLAKARGELTAAVRTVAWPEALSNPETSSANQGPSSIDPEPPNLQPYASNLTFNPMPQPSTLCPKLNLQPYASNLRPA